MTNQTIPIARTNLLDSEINSVLEPLRSGWLVQGPYVADFEKKWSEYTGARHSIAVSSCTAGLELSLVALGFGEKQEAVVPAFTWVSTANIIEHLGGKVVFADVDLETFNVNSSLVEEKITKNTKAVLPVHLFGLAADIDNIVALAAQNDLLVVEDAACGFGSFANGRHVGNMGHTGCFSFHPRKAITTGEGGMITTQSAELAEKLRCFRDHGANVTDLQRHLGPKPYTLSDHSEAGYNQRMTDIQGVLGSTQMDRAAEIVAERRYLANRYNEAFKNLDSLQTPNTPADCLHGFQSYPCLFMPEKVKTAVKRRQFDTVRNVHHKRNEFMERLQNVGISTRPATHAVHMLSFYKDKYKLKPESFPNAMAANDCSMSLPLFTGMTLAEQDFVIEQVVKFKI